MAKLSKKERLEEVLENLADSLGSDLLGALVATYDGQVIVSLPLKSGLDAQKLAAMAAAIVGTSDKLSKIVDTGAFEDVFVRCDDEDVLARKAGKRGILVCVVRKGANVGLLNIEIEDVTSAIKEILEG